LCASCNRSLGFPGKYTLVYSTNKNVRHDITEILLKMALRTINQTKPNQNPFVKCTQIMLYVQDQVYLCTLELVLFVISTYYKTNYNRLSISNADFISYISVFCVIITPFYIFYSAVIVNVKHCLKKTIRGCRKHDRKCTETQH
jgi:hypothetical protein